MGPLDGIRVIEMAGMGPGPFAAMLGTDGIRPRARSDGGCPGSVRAWPQRVRPEPERAKLAWAVAAHASNPPLRLGAPGEPATADLPESVPAAI